VNGFELGDHLVETAVRARHYDQYAEAGCVEPNRQRIEKVDESE